MKKTLPYIIICLLIASLVIIRFSFDDDESVEPDATSKGAIEASKGTSQSTKSEPDVVEGPIPGSPEWWRKGYETPMDFYGLVLDQYGVPVAGAQVVFSWNPRHGDGKSSTTTSDANGRFEFLGRKGKSLGVRVSKDGYYHVKSTDGSRQGFDFFVPGGTPEHLSDPNDPAIFHLKKKGEGVDLIISEFRNKLPQSGETKIDLLTGRLSPNGQLELYVERQSEERHFPWTAKAVIKGGGFVKAEGQFMHEAPEDGYVEELEWVFPLNEKGRQRNVAFKEDYYVTFGSPKKYGRIMIYLKADSWHLLLESWINPDGGRNLEPKGQ